MKIVVIGAGYVGLANAVLLARSHQVVAVDLDQRRVDALNARVSPIADTLLGDALQSSSLSLKATTTTENDLADADFAIIATPTDYDPNAGYFDTTSVEAVLDSLRAHAFSGVAVIKSTIPVGFTKRMRLEHPNLRIVFSPEFLREGRALADNLHPSRIVVSGDEEGAQEFARLMLSATDDPANVPVLNMGSTEAEAVKLFANTYLAMRVAFFNELDTFAQQHQLDAESIIRGVSSDPRVGHHYNNPSFGYGGYCLPKDSKQLLANFHDVPQVLIKAIVDANDKRMDFIADSILVRHPQIVGVYKLSMKASSDNFRSSSTLGVIERLQKKGVNIQIYEPSFDSQSYDNIPVIQDFEEFAKSSDVIIANRLSVELHPYSDKVYCRDVFLRD